MSVKEINSLNSVEEDQERVKRLSEPLTRLEFCVMNEILQLENCKEFTAKDVFNLFKDYYHYNSTLTVLQQLRKKGYVDKIGKRGKEHILSVAIGAAGLYSLSLQEFFSKKTLTDMEKSALLEAIQKL
jgi:predicted transcriptional regulator